VVRRLSIVELFKLPLREIPRDVNIAENQGFHSVRAHAC